MHMDVELVNLLRLAASKSVQIICLDTGDCTTLYNPSIRLVWDNNGNLVEVRLSGYDSDGELVEFRKTLNWDSNGNLTQVSGWTRT